MKEKYSLLSTWMESCDPSNGDVDAPLTIASRSAESAFDAVNSKTVDESVKSSVLLSVAWLATLESSKS